MLMVFHIFLATPAVEGENERKGKKGMSPS
jgi:hypothetical protein